MNLKKMLGRVGVVAVMALGTGVGAEEPEKTAPPPEKARAPAPEQTFRLKPGQVKDLPMKDMTRVALGDPEVANVQVVGDSIRITAHKKGETTLLVWTVKDERHVYAISVGN